MSWEDYVTKAMQQLNKEEHYRQLDQKYTTQLAQLLGEVKDRHSVDEETWKFLTLYSMWEQQYSTCYPRFTNPVTLAGQLCPHVGHKLKRFPNLWITTYATC